MEQTIINFLPATRHEGMQNAEAHANADVPGWSALALEFIRTYAMKNEFVFAQDVSDEAEGWGLVEPPDLRAWGGVYLRAQHQGIIKRTDMARRRWNGSLAMVYRSLLWKGLK